MADETCCTYAILGAAGVWEGNYFSDSSPGDVYHGASKEPEAPAQRANRSLQTSLMATLKLVPLLVIHVLDLGIMIGTLVICQLFIIDAIWIPRCVN